MEAARSLSIASLRMMIGSQHFEEERLRTILGGNPPRAIRIQAEFDLERLVRTRNNQSDEIVRLEAMERPGTVAQFGLSA
jgi:hypothetical protein